MNERTLACVMILAAGCVTLGNEDANGIDDGGETSFPGGSGSGSGSGSTGSLRVFATHGTYSGDLTSYLGDAINGLAAGDRICQLRADSAGLGGKWRAWLSSSQIDAIDRVSGDGPWKLVGTTLAFANRAQLQTEPSVAIDVDEHGESIRDAFDYTYVWTGTHAGGVHGAATCGDWTSTMVDGVYGLSQPGSFEWTDYSTGYCSEEKHLICLEQAL